LEAEKQAPPGNERWLDGVDRAALCLLFEITLQAVRHRSVEVSDVCLFGIRHLPDALQKALTGIE
jgi:hypothetical protein